MSLAITDEQEALRTTVRQFLAEQAPMSEVRRVMETREGYDAAVWSRMATQLGLHGLAVPEQYGGAGYGFTELTLVLEEMGRALLPSPFLATFGLALPALRAAGDERAQKAYLPAMAAGEVIATVAWVEDDGDWGGTSAGTVARRDGVDWVLDGHKSFILDGHLADLLLVHARTTEGPSIFAVDPEAAGLTRRQLSTLDQTRRLARVELHGTRATLIGDLGAGRVALQEAVDHAAVLLAAEMVGGGQACLDMSVDYAKVREQFGRPIGSFQSIKHKCADMLVQLEGARSAAYYAGWAAAENRDELPKVARLAKACAAETYFHAAAENIQIHGGIGFTWEHDAHLYFKRAKSSDLLFGDVGFQRRRLADLIGF